MLKPESREQGRLSPAEAVRLALDCLAGLEACHSAGIVHRDRKPENLLYDSAGRLKVADLGIARAVEVTEDLTATGAILGTPRYIAPEQVLGEQAGPRADLFAMGIILHEMIVGETPQYGSNVYNMLKLRADRDVPSILERAPDVPGALAEVISGGAWDHKPRPERCLGAAGDRTISDGFLELHPGAVTFTRRDDLPLEGPSTRIPWSAQASGTVLLSSEPLLEESEAFEGVGFVTVRLRQFDRPLMEPWQQISGSRVGCRQLCDAAKVCGGQRVIDASAYASDVRGTHGALARYVEERQATSGGHRLPRQILQGLTVEDSDQGNSRPMCTVNPGSTSRPSSISGSESTRHVPPGS